MKIKEATRNQTRTSEIRLLHMKIKGISVKLKVAISS